MDKNKTPLRLTWSAPQPSNKEIRYDHVTAETPLGRILITWKSWKEFNSPTVDEHPVPDFFYSGADVEDAQRAAEVALFDAISDLVAVTVLPPAQILDLAARCGIKASESALVEFAGLVRNADPLPAEEMRPPAPQIAEEEVVELPSIDTPEFRELLYAWHIATDGERAGEKGAALIGHIDNHTRDAIAASRRAAGGEDDIYALKEQASAWIAVFQVLSEVAPSWLDGTGRGIDKAIAAIRALAAPACTGQAAPVSVVDLPVAGWAAKRKDGTGYGSWLHTSESAAKTHLEHGAGHLYEVVALVERAAQPAEGNARPCAHLPADHWRNRLDDSAEGSAQVAKEWLTDAVDAAMTEMANIHPPLRRKDCERLIRAALADEKIMQVASKQWPASWHDIADQKQFEGFQSDPLVNTRVLYARSAPAAPPVAMPAIKSVARFSDTQQRGVLIICNGRVSDDELEAIRVRLAATPPASAAPAAQLDDNDRETLVQAIQQLSELASGTINSLGTTNLLKPGKPKAATMADVKRIAPYIVNGLRAVVTKLDGGTVAPTPAAEGATPADPPKLMREQAVDLLLDGIIIESGARKLRNGDQVLFNLQELTDFANMARMSSTQQPEGDK